MVNKVLPLPIFIPHGNGTIPLPLGLAIIAVWFVMVFCLLWYWSVKR